MSAPKRVSIIPPPPAAGSFKIETIANETIIATPSKQGKVQGTLSHAHDKDAGKWSMLPTKHTPTSKLAHAPSSSPPRTPAGTKFSSTTTGGITGSTPLARLFAVGPSSGATKTAGHIPSTAPAPPTMPEPSTVPPNEVQQPFKMLIENDLINKTSNASVAGEINIAIPRYDSKRGRDLCDKASIGLPAAERNDIKQTGTYSYLKLLRRASDCCFWGVSVKCRQDY